MPELLCRRDRDGDGVDDEYAVREDLVFLNGDGLLGCQHLTAPNPEGLITVSLKFKWRGGFLPRHLVRN